MTLFEKCMLFIGVPLMVWCIFISKTYESRNEERHNCNTVGRHWTEGDSKPLMPVWGECE